MICPVDVQRAAFVVLEALPVARVQEAEVVGFARRVFVVQPALVVPEGLARRGRLVQFDPLVGDVEGPLVGDVGVAVCQLGEEFRRADQHETGRVEELLRQVPDESSLPDMVAGDVKVLFVADF